jgi:hypothetical protein
MSISFTTSNKWMAREELPGVRFFRNDSVTITSGSESGQTASVISLIEVEPEAVYLVATKHGNDVRVAQSKLSPNGA